MKKALIFYGGWDGHTPKETAHLFAEILREEGFETVLADTLTVLDDYESIKDYDLFVPVWTMGEISWEQENNICRAVEEGAGIAGCHGGMCDSFRSATNWQFMTGSQWVAHPGNSGVTYTVKMKHASSSSIIDGIADFDVTSEQYYIHVDPAVDVLATTVFKGEGNHMANGEVEVPVVYTKKWGKGKVFYNSLGHNRYIFDIPEAKELMRRGFLYAAR